MTPGQRAYEEDVRRQPTYHDGTPRPPFSALGDAVRNNWERHPTPREWPWRGRS
jgi:hypothetical protein